MLDPAWNISSRTTNTATRAYTLNSLNQIASTFDGSFLYDGNGNMVDFNSGDLTLVWDDENQLTAIDNLSFKSQYVYDGKNRLRKKLDYQWVSGAWSNIGETRYIYDGMLFVQERNSSNVPTVAYTRGPDLSGSLEGAGGIGGLLLRTSSYNSGTGLWGAWNYYHADGNGNITCMVGLTQSTTATYKYDPYGNLLGSSGTLAAANTMRFSSKQIDPTFGNYYYGYRWYSPNYQRWLNRDPLGEEGGLNLYGFLENEPIDYIDPFGENALGIGQGFFDNWQVWLPPAMGAVATLPEWFPPAAAAAGGGAIGVGAGTWLNNNTPVGNIGPAIGNLICPIKTNYKNNSGRPNIGKRSKSNTRKGAFEKAKKAGKGNPPVHHPNDPGQRPHFHPGDGHGRPLNHDHYYY